MARIFASVTVPPRLRNVGHLPAIIATEALASRIKGTAVYGRRTMLAIANPSTAVEGKISEDPDKQREVTYRFVDRKVTGDRSGGNNRHAADGIPIGFRSSQS
jgi:hypothetical protein